MERFLIVRVAGQECAVPAAQIHGMCQANGLSLTPVEGRGPVRFQAEVGGRMVGVMGANQLLGLPARPVSARSCLLMVQDGGLALLVDSVSRFEDLPPALIRPEMVRLSEKWRRLLDLSIICSSVA